MDAVSSLARFTSPNLIPLPPSPPPSPTLPDRKPVGWVSTLTGLSSARFANMAMTDDRQSSDGDRDHGPKGDHGGEGARGAHSEGDGIDGSSAGHGLWGIVGADRHGEGEEVSTRDEPGEYRRQPEENNREYQGRATQSDDVAEQTPGDIGVTSTRHTTVPAPAPMRRSQAIGLGRPGHRPVSVSVSGSVPQRAIRPHAGSGTSGRRATGPVTSGGRTVSGAMQYALLPFDTTNDQLPSIHAGRITSFGSSSISDEAPRTVSTVSDMLMTPRIADERNIAKVAHDHFGEADDDGRVEDDFHAMLESNVENTSTSDAYERYGSETRPEWLDEVPADQQADEEWMQYVRVQLNALFPDFCNGENDLSGISGTSGEPGESEDYGIASREGATTSTAVHAPVLVDPTLAGRQAMETLPGVRGEISDLREEIERLRGVVGGLADGLMKQGHGRQEDSSKAGGDKLLLQSNRGGGSVQPDGSLGLSHVAATGRKDEAEILPSTLEMGPTAGEGQLIDKVEVSFVDPAEDHVARPEKQADTEAQLIEQVLQAAARHLGISKGNPEDDGNGHGKEEESDDMPLERLLDQRNLEAMERALQSVPCGQGSAARRKCGG